MIPNNNIDFYGDHVRWFMGRVISLNDPLEMGRVRIRIFGIHDSPEITENDLPWAQVVIPITEGSSSGIGTNVGIKEQAQVYGIFFDGKNSQLPLVIGSITKLEDVLETQVDDPRGRHQVPTPGLEKNLRPADEIDDEFLNGETNIEKAYNFLISKEGGNLSSAQAAGVIGNFCVESGANQNSGDINPIAQAPGEGSFGIAQWNPATDRYSGLLNMAAELNITYTSLYAQLLWTRTELIRHSYLGYGELKQARDPEEAALIFMRKYERPGYETQSNSSRIKGSDGKDRRLGQDERIEFAQEVYSVFNS